MAAVAVAVAMVVANILPGQRAVTRNMARSI